MNNSARTTFQVGLLVVVGIAVVFGCYIFFNGTIRQHNTYPLTALFDDAQGIDKQANVELAGVKIGSVSAVGLSPTSGKAIVSLLIDKKYLIPKNSDFLITAGILGGSATLAIVPPKQLRSVSPGDYLQPGSVVAGSESLNFAAIQAQTGNLLKQFSVTTAKANSLLDSLAMTTGGINRMLADPRLKSSLFSTVQNLNQASQNGLFLTQDLHSALMSDNKQLATMLGNFDQTSATLNTAAAENKAKISEIVDNLNRTTEAAAEMSTQANRTLQKGQTVQNLSDMVENLKQATAKLNSIESNISGLTGDPAVQSDLKVTLHNAALASGQTRILVERLSALTGGKHAPTIPGSLQFQSRLDFTQNFRSNKFRTDFDIYAPLSTLDFARIGIYDLTESNKLNLQYGQLSPYNKFLDYRAGVYAGKVGIGADYNLFGKRSLSFDLYDPNRLRLDARERIRVNKNAAVTLGIDDVPRSNAVTLGLELNR